MCAVSKQYFFPETLTHLLPAAWCGAGADHYEPLVATILEDITADKAAVVL
jgi:hypothetical protein